MSAPRVPAMVNGPTKECEVVATLAKVLTPEKYGMLPWTAAVDVERPPKERIGVFPPVLMIGKVPVTEETPLLMLEVATHCGTPLFQARTWPPIPVPKRVLVEIESEFDEPRPVIEPERLRPSETVEVATFASVFGPEKYARLPTTGLVEVERPL